MAGAWLLNELGRGLLSRKKMEVPWETEILKSLLRKVSLLWLVKTIFLIVQSRHCPCMLYLYIKSDKLRR